MRVDIAGTQGGGTEEVLNSIQAKGADSSQREGIMCRLILHINFKMKEIQENLFFQVFFTHFVDQIRIPCISSVERGNNTLVIFEKNGK